MDDNPYKPPITPLDGEPASPLLSDAERALTDPALAYTANGNLEAHSVVTWLQSHGVQSHAVEDNSGVSLFAFGTISQFHKPQVFVNGADLQKAGELLRQFESQRDKRRADLSDAPPITSQCEECGVASDFPAAQDGTTQNCPKCNAFIDVGALGWPDDHDFGDPEPEPQRADNADDAMDAATKLDKAGDWDAAINAYRDVAAHWPEHATYAANCIADVQRKIDASR